MYAGIDLETNKKIVLKVCNERDMNKVETNVMKVLNKKGFKNFPTLYETGVYKEGPGMIIERFGKTLDDVLSDRLE